jgi:hypothetical protein
LRAQLLKYRPVKDLKETLLHEMIHAYMFLVRAWPAASHPVAPQHDSLVLGRAALARTLRVLTRRGWRWPCALQEGIRDHDDHGPKFKAKMHAINASRAPDHQRPAEGYKIDTHHTMIDEARRCVELCVT